MADDDKAIELKNGYKKELLVSTDKTIVIGPSGPIITDREENEKDCINELIKICDKKAESELLFFLSKAELKCGIMYCKNQEFRDISYDDFYQFPFYNFLRFVHFNAGADYWLLKVLNRMPPCGPNKVPDYINPYKIICREYTENFKPKEYMAVSKYVSNLSEDMHDLYNIQNPPEVVIPQAVELGNLNNAHNLAKIDMVGLNNFDGEN